MRIVIGRGQHPDDISLPIDDVEHPKKYIKNV